MVIMIIIIEHTEVQHATKRGKIGESNKENTNSR